MIGAHTGAHSGAHNAIPPAHPFKLSKGHAAGPGHQVALCLSCPALFAHRPTHERMHALPISRGADSTPRMHASHLAVVRRVADPQINGPVFQKPHLKVQTERQAAPVKKWPGRGGRKRCPARERATAPPVSLQSHSTILEYRDSILLCLTFCAR